MSTDISERDMMILDLMCVLDDYTVGVSYEEGPTEVTIEYETIVDELLKRGWHLIEE